jgi:hypothetical protein
MKLENIQVRASKGDLQEFKRSIIWGDMKRELHAWRKAFETEMRSIVDNASKENPSTANVLMHIGDINGRIKAVDYMMSLLDVFIDILDVEERKSTQPITQEDEPDGN